MGNSETKPEQNISEIFDLDLCKKELSSGSIEINTNNNIIKKCTFGLPELLHGKNKYSKYQKDTNCNVKQVTLKIQVLHNMWGGLKLGVAESDCNKSQDVLLIAKSSYILNTDQKLGKNRKTIALLFFGLCKQKHKCKKKNKQTKKRVQKKHTHKDIAQPKFATK